jgi:hypothetical protein
VNWAALWIVVAVPAWFMLLGFILGRLTRRKADR